MNDSSGARQGRKAVYPGHALLTTIRDAMFLMAGCLCLTLGIFSPEASATADSRETFSIQLNAFADKHNAEKFVLAMRAKGWHPYMVSYGEGGRLYKILLGPYGSKEEALQEVHVLSRKEKLKAIIIPAIYPEKAGAHSAVAAEAKLQAPSGDSAPRTAKASPEPGRTPANGNTAKRAVKTSLPPKKAGFQKNAPQKADYDSVDIVMSLFLAWLKAWQGNEADAYLLFYSNDFKYTGKSLEAWKKSRRYALEKNKNIAINFSDIQILQGRDAVEISFVQQYKSDNHADRGHKTLAWKKEGEVWRITREDWLPL